MSVKGNFFKKGFPFGIHHTKISHTGGLKGLQNLATVGYCPRCAIRTVDTLQARN